MPFFPQLTAAALLLVTAVPGSAWAGAPFNKTMQLQGTNFQVQSRGEGSQQQLTITTTGAKPAIKPIRQTVNGQVVGAEVADLNNNGLPESYVYVQGAGSGSYGEVVAYAVMKGNELSPITLPELTGANAEGYQGHDQFQVVEDCLALLPDLQTRRQQRQGQRRPTADLLQAQGRRSRLDPAAHQRGQVLNLSRPACL
jgi:hypothetical protein